MSRPPQIPKYLEPYCKEQDYERYTPREHATWRYILRQARDYFSRQAVPTYLEGLKKTGISIDKIPSIENIDRCLKDLGWGAIGVSGFIPPAAFLDLQSRSIMPIAMDMRTLEHVSYTPAPDIVHEAAGHMPILVEKSYRSYLSRYANVARKAVISVEDIQLYEAIRALSDIKENPDTKPSEIEAAQAHLNKTVSSMSAPTELAKVARMNWWTAEYGLVGTLEDPKIYGAGLLSSVGESRHCMTQAVKKIPLSVKCVEQAYDITEPQPQLYVAESLEQLTCVLEELEATMAFKIGGSIGIKRALQSKTVNTIVFENGFSASGIIESVLEESGDPIFLKLQGPVQLGYCEKELKGQGRGHHPVGFSSPLGKWKRSSMMPFQMSDSDLKKIGIEKGKRCQLEFVSGFKVEGEVVNWVREEGRLGILQWKDCTVTRGEQVFYRPEWGAFDQILGVKAVSVHGGPADREEYGEYDLGKVSTSPGRQSPYSVEEKQIFGLYKALSIERSERKWTKAELLAFAEKVETEAPREWLLDLEMLELAEHNPKVKPDKAWLIAIEQRLIGKAKTMGSVISDLAARGMALVSEP